MDMTMHHATREEASVGDLVSRLAHEGKELAALEVRRLRVEMREQTRRAATAAAAGHLAIELIALAALGLGIGLFFVLADWWGNYAAAAFATSGAFAAGALVLGLAVRGMARRIFGALHAVESNLEQDGRAIRGS